MKVIMPKYRLYRRGTSGRFYLEDRDTGKQTSLKTSNKEEAGRLLNAHNEAIYNPSINRKIAIAYLAASDPEMVGRTWQQVMQQFAIHGEAATVKRKQCAIRDKAFDLIRHKKLIETTADDFLQALDKGSVSTNVFLRKIHNYAIDLDWLPKVVLPKKHWPKVRHQKKRAITWLEHLSIIDREGNEERKLYYDFLWETGASQGDAARLEASNIDWKQNILVIYRKKLDNQEQPPSKVRIGKRLVYYVNFPHKALFFLI
jgi:integrase